jgi:Na+/proline symporter
VPKRKSSPRPPTRQRNPWLGRLIIITMIMQIVLATWAFVNIGSMGLTRYEDWGAEILTVIAASTAGCAWLTYQWKRVGAYGLFIGLALGVLFLLTNKPKDPQALPGLGESMIGWTIFVTVALGAIIYLGIRPLWRDFERF